MLFIHGIHIFLECGQMMAENEPRTIGYLRVSRESQDPEKNRADILTLANREDPKERNPETQGMKSYGGIGTYVRLGPTLPAGNHPVVAGANRQTLPVGSYPGNGARSRKRKATAPAQDALVAEFHAMEEKGSDVNLAAHLLNDAWKGLFDAAAVISNDTDLVTPIRMVTVERGKPVFIVCPGRWQVAPKLKQAATYVRHVRAGQLKVAQFPDTLSGTGISKPAGW